MNSPTLQFCFPNDDDDNFIFEPSDELEKWLISSNFLKDKDDIVVQSSSEDVSQVSSNEEKKVQEQEETYEETVLFHMKYIDEMIRTPLNTWIKAMYYDSTKRLDTLNGKHVRIVLSYFSEWMNLFYDWLNREDNSDDIEKIKDHFMKRFDALFFFIKRFTLLNTREEFDKWKRNVLPVIEQENAPKDAKVWMWTDIFRNPGHWKDMFSEGFCVPFSIVEGFASIKGRMNNKIDICSSPLPYKKVKLMVVDQKPLLLESDDQQDEIADEPLEDNQQVSFCDMCSKPFVHSTFRRIYDMKGWKGSPPIKDCAQKGFHIPLTKDRISKGDMYVFGAFCNLYCLLENAIHLLKWHTMAKNNIAVRLIREEAQHTLSHKCVHPYCGKPSNKYLSLQKKWAKIHYSTSQTTFIIVSDFSIFGLCADQYEAAITYVITTILHDYYEEYHLRHRK